MPPFPATWEDFVSLWKAKKPLEARKFEEAIAIEYSQNRIELAIAPEGLAAAELASQDSQRLIKQSLRRLCGFHGEFCLRVKELTDTAGESILAHREKERDTRRQADRQAAAAHPWTLGILRELGGQILSIHTQDG